MGEEIQFEPLPIKLAYYGLLSDEHQLDLYDLSQALQGLERSLALTTHLILNDEVITQATALKGARIVCGTPKAGSFTILAGIGMVGYGAYKLGTLKKDNPLGHLVYSAYDYVVHKVTGQDLDYDKSLREVYENGKSFGTLGIRLPKASKFDSLAEKIEPPLTKLHRPMISSGTAESGVITFPGMSKKTERSIVFDHGTYGQLKYRNRADEITNIRGKVSVFNPNTFNGRLFIPEKDRTVPFFLTHAGRSPGAFNLIGKSYTKNLNDRNAEDSILEFDVLTTRSKLGRVVKYTVIKVRDIDNSNIFDVIEDI